MFNLYSERIECREDNFHRGGESGIHIAPILVVIEKTVGAIHGGHHGKHDDTTFKERGAHMSNTFTEEVDMTTTKCIGHVISNVKVENSLKT